MDIKTLRQTVQALVSPGKGILAADESTKTITKRFEAIGVKSSESTRFVYRKMLLTTPGIEEYISGVILYDETIRQGLKNPNIITGIKVDKGAWKLPGFEREKYTEGLDGLRDRLTEYKNMGARFAKWRAVITIGEGLSSQVCISANVESLALYAALCQEQNIVPIVEPEVLMEGNHDLSRCKEVTTQVLKSVFDKLQIYNVAPEGMLLKPNMIIPGKESGEQASAEEIAQATIEAFKEVVPQEVPGIVFLSGGQTPDQATENLAAINAIAGPWELSYSFGRALQDEALKAWAGKPENVKSAQKVFLERCKKVSLARSG